MPKARVTLFTWGYDGWGNWTDKLVQAVDAVERSRGWGRPLFVDVRASRKVRAKGFRERAFEERFGPGRYRWMGRLGNAAILGRKSRGRLVDPSAAAELLDLALEMQGKRRRIIYFCSCVSPTDGCHRHWVTPNLLRLARQRRQPVTVVEWPGFDSQPAIVQAVKTTGRMVGRIKAGRVSLPLGPELPGAALLGLPWFTLVDLVDASNGRRADFMLSGPAEHRAGRWQLPVMGGEETVRETLKLQRSERKGRLVLPRSWPASPRIRNVRSQSRA